MLEHHFIGHERDRGGFGAGEKVIRKSSRTAGPWDSRGRKRLWEAEGS